MGVQRIVPVNLVGSVSLFSFSFFLSFSLASEPPIQHNLEACHHINTHTHKNVHTHTHTDLPSPSLRCLSFFLSNIHTVPHTQRDTCTHCPSFSVFASRTHARASSKHALPYYLSLSLSLFCARSLSLSISFLPSLSLAFFLSLSLLSFLPFSLY